MEIKTTTEIWTMRMEDVPLEQDVLEKKWSPVDEQVEWLEKQYAELNEFTADKNTGTILDVMTQFQERIKQLKGE
jgi:hypothetical protein